MFRKIRKAAGTGLAALLLLLLCGCGEKVVTVSSVLDEDGQAGEYIELQEFVLKEKEQDSGRENVRYCVVMIPAGYYESEEIPGMYLHERAPLDSSNIYYTVSDGSGEGSVSEALTQAAYQEIMENALLESGREGSLTVDSFEEIDMDGVKTYKIRSTYTMEDNAIQQLTYLVLAENTYTITYSQSADDELLADFELADGKIRLVKEESVQTAALE